MASIKDKRKRFMDKLLKSMSIIDPTGNNTRKYHEFFGKMTDKEFDSYLRNFFSDEKNTFYIESVEYVNDLTLENIEKASDYIGLKLFETVCIPHANGDKENALVTPTPVAVGPIHMKLMVQMLMEKNNISTGIEKRSSKTGTVVGDDKASRMSDVESYSMVIFGAEKGLQELLGPRADNELTKHQMYQSIADEGECSLDELVSGQRSKVAMNTLDMYFKMQMLKTNVLDDTDLI